MRALEFVGIDSYGILLSLRSSVFQGVGFAECRLLIVER
jgi:hypothetical protein